MTLPRRYLITLTISVLSLYSCGKSNKPPKNTMFSLSMPPFNNTTAWKCTSVSVGNGGVKPQIHTVERVAQQGTNPGSYQELRVDNIVEEPNSEMQNYKFVKRIYSMDATIELVSSNTKVIANPGSILNFARRIIVVGSKPLINGLLLEKGIFKIEKINNSNNVSCHTSEYVATGKSCAYATAASLMIQVGVGTLPPHAFVSEFPDPIVGVVEEPIKYDRCTSLEKSYIYVLKPIPNSQGYSFKLALELPDNSKNPPVPKDIFVKQNQLVS